MIELPPLPYAKDALAPHISAETLGFHHGKHHKTYVETANKLIKGSEFETLPLEEIIRRSAGKAEHRKIFNNAGQAWNHNFYWQSMAPKGGGKPSGKLAEKIDADFGGFDKFRDLFQQEGAAQFGSGWVWLTLAGGKLKVLPTANADNPLTRGEVPLLVSDVWEHAYYLDYQNRRPDYLAAFMEHVANWEFAERNFAEAGAASRAA
jgi:Fe-Mn family superoxide dismutase